MTDATHTSPEEPEPVKTGMEIGDILKILPHRYPFLLIDRVIELERMKSIVALKNVTITEPFFSGHLPRQADHAGRADCGSNRASGRPAAAHRGSEPGRDADGIHGHREGAIPASSGGGRSAAH